MSAMTSSRYVAWRYVPISSTEPRECIKTTPAWAAAAISPIRGSIRKPDTSLMISAPSASAADATSDFVVSTEIGRAAKRRRIARTTGRIRLCSSAAETEWASCGRVDSPPTSSASAPSATIRSTCTSAASVDSNCPPSLKESGVTLRIPTTKGRSRASSRPLIRQTSGTRGFRCPATVSMMLTTVLALRVSATGYRTGAVSKVRDHRDLRVWQAAIELGIRCYEVSKTFPREERYGLTAQLRSAAVSVAANIAEGNGRLTRGEYLNHLSNARGSLREIDTHLEFAYRLGYATTDAIRDLRDLIDVAAALLTRLIQSLQ